MATPDYSHRVITPSEALDYKTQALGLVLRIQHHYPQGMPGEYLFEDAASLADLVRVMRNAVPTVWGAGPWQVAQAAWKQAQAASVPLPRPVLDAAWWHIFPAPVWLVQTDAGPVPLESIIVAPIRRSGGRLGVTLRGFCRVDAIQGWPAGPSGPMATLALDWDNDESAEALSQRLSRHSSEDRQELLVMEWAAAVAMIFINQKVMHAGLAPVERHARKRAACLNVAPTVHVVRFRKDITDQAPTDTPNAVEWACRWMVRGHWRQQYHPSTGRHEPTWILPYIKGPTDKPFREPPPTVNVVTH